MRLKVRLFFFGLLLLCLESVAQFPISPNAYDANGKRTGHWTILYDSTFKKEVKDADSAKYYRLVRYADGNTIGKVRDFYRTGQKQWEGYLISMLPDVPVGEAINYHQNGKIYYRANYVDKKLSGPYHEYSVNGNLIAEGSMEKDSAIGKWNYYNEEGLRWLVAEKKGKKSEWYKQYHPNGQLRSEGLVVNNLMQGLWIVYYEDGKISSRCEYKNGVKNGTWEWYNKEGIIEEAGRYLNDQKFGNWKVWYDGAKSLKEQGTYDSAGKVNGYWTYYFPNGSKKSEGEMKDGGNVGNWKFYYNNGVVQTEGYLLKGFYEGEIKSYFSSGKLESIATYVRDTIHGSFISYFENGNVNANGVKVNGKKDGLWTYRFENGSVDGTEQLNLGVLDGKAINYYPDGKIKAEGIFKNGKRNELYVSYHANGQLEAKGVYEEDKRTGEWNWYYDNGQLESKRFYKDDLPDGMYVDYHRSGSKMAEGIKREGKRTGWTKNYFFNGKLGSEGNYIENGRDGIWTYYDSITGIKISSGVCKKDKYNGKWKNWDANGKSIMPEYYFMGWREDTNSIRDSIKALVRAGQYDKAWASVSWLKKVIKRDLSKDNSSNSLPFNLYGYILYYGKGETQKAIPWLEEYRKQLLQYNGNKDPNYQTALNDLANAYSALKQYDKALTFQDSLLALERGNTDRKDFNIYLYNKATTLSRMGKVEEADKLFDEEILAQQNKGKNSPDVWAIRKKEAEFYNGWEYDYEKAIALYKNLLDDVKATAPKNTLVLELTTQMAYMNNALIRRTETIWWLKASTRFMEEAGISSFSDYFHDLSLLANNYLNIGFLDSATMVYNKMQETIASRNLLNSRFHAELLDGQAEVFFKNYKTQKALDVWLQAKSILEESKQTNIRLYPDVLSALAMAYNNVDNYEEAEKTYLQSLAIDKKINNGIDRAHLSSMIELANIYTDHDEYEKGTNLLTEVIKLIGEVPTPTLIENYAKAWKAMGDIKKSLGKYQEAIECNKKTILYLEKNKVNSYELLSDVLVDISRNYKSLQDYESAEKYLLQSIKVIEEIEGKDNYNYLRLRISLAYYYRDRSLYTEAEKIFLEAIKSIENLYGKSDIRYAYAIKDLASSYRNEGEYKKAESRYIQYRDLLTTISGTHTSDYLDALYRLASISFRLDKIALSEKLYKECILLTKQLYGDQHPEYASYLRDLARLYNFSGRLSEAEALMNIAAPLIGKSAYGKTSSLYASYITFQGEILAAREKHQEAEQLLQEAVAITSVNKTDYFDEYVSANEALANFYGGLGQYNSTEKLRLEVMSVVEARYGKDFYYASVSTKLLELYYISGRHEKVISFGSELLAYFENELARDNYRILDIHNLIGLAELAKNNFEAAASHFNYCIEMRDLNKTQRSSAYAAYINNLSLTKLAKGDFVGTETLLNQAASIRTELGIKLDPRGYALITDNYASLYQAWGKLELSEKYWLDVTQKLLVYAREKFYFMSDEEKSQFWKDIKNDFEYFNTFAVLRAKQNPAILGEMYNNQLATKAILLSASNKIKKRILTSKDTVMVNHYYNWVEMREQLAQLYTSSDSDLKNKKIRIDSLEQQAKNIEKELNISADDVANDKGGQNKVITWNDVQKALSPNEAAIEIIRFRYFDRYLRDSVIYAALIVTAETKLNPKLVIIPDGRLLEGRGLRFYKNAINAQLEDKRSYNLFWAAIDPLVKNKTRLYLSLDGVYNQINLNTLADAEGKFLVESKNITILSNTKDLLLLKSKRNTRNTTTTASLFGYPKFFMGKQRLQERGQSQNRDVDFSAMSDTDSTGIGELPGTQTEIAEIKDILSAKHWQTLDYTDESATEKSLKSVSYPRLLHIATHGYFVDEQEASATFKVGSATEYARQNPLLRSGLLLTGASNFIQNDFRMDDENGILTAYEAANLNLDNTDLVILSACETGKGEVQNGEGVYGLQRAFQTAGAKSIIMSLWKVDDTATQELMTNFYTNWTAGNTKSEAFKRAQLSLKEKYPNPYYWGAFVMMGE